MTTNTKQTNNKSVIVTQNKKVNVVTKPEFNFPILDNDEQTPNNSVKK